MIFVTSIIEIRATRNSLCDANMLRELGAITNPTARELVDKSIVYPIIGTKKRFG